MFDKSNISFLAQSDAAFLKMIGEFIRYHRLNQNKSQQQLATEAGINRTTLLDFEKGKRANLLTFIELLRALGLLHVLESFRVLPQLSPLQLAELDMAKRKRASKQQPGTSVKKNTSDW